jgi:hypothetical protein
MTSGIFEKTARAALCVFAVLGLLVVHPGAAKAVPAFARQTGQECSSCHVGSFGPQLTSFGRTFKLNGYTMGQVKNKLENLSAMIFGGFEKTSDDMRKGVDYAGHPTAFSTASPNDNWTIDQMSLFYAGGITQHIGALAQMTYSPTAATTAWDNTDVRYANNMTLGGKNLIYGIDVNNNPSVQDVWQTTPAWQFPFASSTLAPTPAAGPFMGGLGGTVTGAGAYGMWNDLLYLEVAGYHTLGDDIQQALGVGGVDTSDHLRGVAPYWRAAVQHDFGPHYVSLGTFGMSSNRVPGDVEGNGTDNILDTAIDATYQFTSSDGLHNISLYGMAMHERQNLGATFAQGGSSNSSDTLNFFRASGSYYYKNTYGLTLLRFVTDGSADATLYGVTGGQTNPRPNSAGWTVQADLTPLGTQGSIGWPYINARFFVQYTAYDKFNGSSANYDGTGRSAAGNNTLFTGLWMAF